MRELYKLREKTLGLYHDDTINSLNSLGYLFSQLNKYEESEKFYLQALERYEEVFGTNHKKTHIVTSNLAYLYINNEENEKAEIFLKTKLHKSNAFTTKNVEIANIKTIWRRR